jgi:hypothetical protein
MRYKRWLGFVGVVVLLLVLNGCAGGETPDVDNEPAATEPPSSIVSIGSHLVVPTAASPNEKVEPTRAISPETAAEIGQTIGVAAGGPQSNSPVTADNGPIHRNSHVLYLLILVRR